MACSGRRTPEVRFRLRWEGGYQSKRRAEVSGRRGFGAPFCALFSFRTPQLRQDGLGMGRPAAEGARSPPSPAGLSAASPPVAEPGWTPQGFGLPPSGRGRARRTGGWETWFARLCGFGQAAGLSVSEMRRPALPSLSYLGPGRGRETSGEVSQLLCSSPTHRRQSIECLGVGPG